MFIKTIRKFIFFLAAPTVFVSCSSTSSLQGASWSSLSGSAQSAESAASGASTSSLTQEATQQAETLSPQTLESITKQTPFSKSSSASNVPPQQNTAQLPKYGNWLNRLVGKTLTVNANVDAYANQGFPIIVDIVFVKDASTYTTLTNVLAKNWFNASQQAIANLKTKTNLLEIRELTLLPQKHLYTYLVRAPRNTIAGLLFVRLVGNDNLYPTLFDPYQNFNLQFSENTFTLQQDSDAGKG